MSVSLSPDIESDTSETVDQNIQLALNVIKERLTKHGKGTAKGSTRSSHLRQKLYETFSTNVDSSSDSDSEEKEAVIQSSTNFFIDRVSNSSNQAKTTTADSSESVETIDLSNINFSLGAGNDPVISDTTTLVSKKKKKKKRNKNNKSHELSSKLKTTVSIDDVYVNVDPLSNPAAQKKNKKKELRHKEPEVMKESVFKEDYEKRDGIESVNTSHRQKKRDRKLEREKTKGDKWYHMAAVELTEEQKNDLKVIQMRKALDPKRFYKANDSEELPKFVQFGRVVESAADFYDSRIPKKQRKATIVEELLADTEFRKYNKRKYEEIQESRRLGKGPYAHMKRLKKQKK